MSNIKISVIIPVYNVAKYLPKCLDSVLSQSLKEIEIILVNDCSSESKDDEICEQYAKKDSRIVYLKNEVNIGLGPTRNCGIESAKGKYISFIDSDDYLLDNKAYLTCYNKLETENCDFVSFGVLGGDAYGNVDNNLWFRKDIYDKQHAGLRTNDSDKQKGFLRDSHAYGGFLSTYAWDKVYKKEFLDRHNIRFLSRTYEDRPFSMAVYLFASKYYIFKNSWYYYFQRADSITQSINEESIDSLFKMNEIEYQFLQENNLLEEYKNLFTRKSMLDMLDNVLMKINNLTISKAEEEAMFLHFKKRLLASNFFDLYMADFEKSKFFMKQLIIFKNSASNLGLAKDLFNSVKDKFCDVKLVVKKSSQIVVNKSMQLVLKLAKIVGRKWGLDAKEIWLISERDNEARDNGYAFFRYLRECYPNLNAFYLINKKSSDYAMVSKLGNVLDLKSFKALVYYTYAKYCFSAHHAIYYYSYNFIAKGINIDSIRCNKKFVFLQHGIIINTLPKSYLNTLNNFNYFTCGAKLEYDFLVNSFKENNYNHCKLIYTGLARYDYLVDKSANKKQILLMPTWRASFINQPLNYFLHSDYYRAYNSLINNNDFNEILEANNYQLVFYPHSDIQANYKNVFKTKCKNMIVASLKNYDVATLLQESNLLITDYSSVFWDFAYMKKPTIYYQFDKAEFRLNHYKEGYFNYDRDGFGAVLESEKDVISKIETYINNSFTMEDEYKNKLSQHFTYSDTHNCDRIVKLVTEGNSTL